MNTVRFYDSTWIFSRTSCLTCWWKYSAVVTELENFSIVISLYHLFERWMRHITNVTGTVTRGFMSSRSYMRLNFPNTADPSVRYVSLQCTKLKAASPYFKEYLPHVEHKGAAESECPFLEQTWTGIPLSSSSSGSRLLCPLEELNRIESKPRERRLSPLLDKWPVFMDQLFFPRELTTQLLSVLVMCYLPFLLKLLPTENGQSYTGLKRSEE